MAHHVPIPLFLTRQNSGDDDIPVASGSGVVSMANAVVSVASENEGLSLNVGDWVVVEYDHVAYPGEVSAIEHATEYNNNVSVMVRAGRYWKWPTPKDTIYYRREQIMRTLKKPVPINSRGHFKFADF